jgi:quinol monooxygenase YgiN
VIVGLGDIYVQIPRREEVRELMRATQASVREQPGCIGYAFAETLDDPGHFVVLQRWRDQAAVDQHYSTSTTAHRPSPTIRRRSPISWFEPPS